MAATTATARRCPRLRTQRPLPRTLSFTMQTQGSPAAAAVRAPRKPATRARDVKDEGHPACRTETHVRGEGGSGGGGQ